MYCKVCNKEIPENEYGTCEDCHKEIIKRLEENKEGKNDIKYCSKCGKILEDESKYCKYCENSLNITKKVETEKSNNQILDENIESLGTNVLVVIAIILIIIASIFVYKAFDCKNNYYNSEYNSSLNENVYVGGDAYNYIINANYFSGYLNFAGSLYIISGICIAVKVLKSSKKLE